MGFPNVEPSTEYLFWFDVANDAGRVEGPRTGFTTFPPGSPPVVLREVASSITATDAVLKARIDTGLQTEWELWLEDPCRGLAECIQDIRVGHGSKPASLSSQAIRLDLAAAEGAPNIEPGGVYAFWVVLRNAAGRTEGQHLAFST
jgi:hypothetical protein